MKIYRCPRCMKLVKAKKLLGPAIERHERHCTIKGQPSFARKHMQKIQAADVLMPVPIRAALTNQWTERFDQFILTLLKEK